MKALALYVLALGFLVLIAFVGWTGWRGSLLGGSLEVHTTQTQIVTIGAGGDTLPGVADSLGVPIDDLQRANATLSPSVVLAEGIEVTVPPEATTWQALVGIHAAGLGAEFLGVFLSFWLALAVGIVPKGYRVQIFGISFVLALASYAAVQAGAVGNPSMTPQFLFGAIKDGFAWSTAFPMFAWALGIRERKVSPAGGVGGLSGTGGARKPGASDVVAEPAAPASPASPPPPPVPPSVS